MKSTDLFPRKTDAFYELLLKRLLLKNIWI